MIHRRVYSQHVGANCQGKVAHLDMHAKACPVQNNYLYYSNLPSIARSTMSNSLTRQLYSKQLFPRHPHKCLVTLLSDELYKRVLLALPGYRYRRLMSGYHPFKYLWHQLESTTKRDSLNYSKQLVPRSHILFRVPLSQSDQITRHDM